MLELLRSLQLLDQDVSLASPYLGLEGQIPPKVIEVIHCSIAPRIEPKFCSDFLADILCSDYPEPELSFRFSRIINALGNHIRNRLTSSQLPLGLIAAAQFRNDEDLWLSLLSYLLPQEQSMGPETVNRILGYAAEARRTMESANPSWGEDLVAKLSQARARWYRSFLGQPERGDDDTRNLMLNQVSWITLGNMALGAELTEVAAFECLRRTE